MLCALVLEGEAARGLVGGAGVVGGALLAALGAPAGDQSLNRNKSSAVCVGTTLVRISVVLKADYSRIVKQLAVNVYFYLRGPFCRENSL